VSAVAAVRLGAARRRWITGAALVVVLLAVAGVSLAVGDYPLSLGQVWTTLLGGGERVEQYVVLQVRAPRLAMALVVGAALGVAGALLQSLLRNPLASPDLLGISGGSSVAAVFVILILGLTGPLVAVAAFVGGMVVAGLLLLAGARRSEGGYRIVLAGVGVSFLCIAVTNFLLVRAKVELAQSALVWMTGTLSASAWWQVATVAAAGVLFLPAVVVAARWLPISQLGAPTAAGLGVRPGVVRWVVVVVAVVLTSVCCAFVGPISFIALCAPAIARPLVGRGSLAIGASGLVGAALLAGSDLLAQYGIPGLGLPVGVVTGALGAVFLLWLLATSKGRQL
jgi:iron complex transport system permease protein